MSSAIRIGTRGSQLALWQANEVSRKLSERGYRPEIVTIKTTADKRQDVPLASIGGKGLFIKELEEALDRGEIDVAVHSLKDVPSIIPPRFALAGFLKRADPRDVWVHPERIHISELAPGSAVGTSSPRRRVQLVEKYSHLKVEPIRGNVDTRIKKATAGLYAGIVLASAGLVRLGRQSEITSYFSTTEMVPAAGQGIIAIEALADRREACEAAASLNDRRSEVAALCERGVLQKFGARLDCYSTVAVHATMEKREITLRAFFADEEGTRSIRVKHHHSDMPTIIASVYEELIARGAMDLLAARKA